MCPFDICPSSLRWWIWCFAPPPNLFPEAVYKTGFLINAASWESDCHLPVMKINVAHLIWRETGILQPVAYSGGARQPKSSVYLVQTYDKKRKIIKYKWLLEMLFFSLLKEIESVVKWGPSYVGRNINTFTIWQGLSATWIFDLKRDCNICLKSNIKKKMVQILWVSHAISAKPS